MRVRRTSKNRVTLPAEIVRQLPEVDYFEVSLREGEVVLRPVPVLARGIRLQVVRARIKALGATEKDVTAAVRWGRRTRR